MTYKLAASVSHQIGGGWGSETAAAGYEKVAVIRGTDIPKIRNGDFSTVPHRFEKSSKLPQRLLETGDLIIEVSGGSAGSGRRKEKVVRQHTGRVLLVTDEILSRLGGTVMPASFCKLVRLDTSKANPAYCSFLIDLMHLNGEIAVFENQSTGISNFQTTKFLEAVTPELDVDAQAPVAQFLVKLDQLRLTTLQQNTALQTIAKSLFRSWFVDFEPVHANAEGTVLDTMSARLSALFPAKLKESELGRIPEGWSVSTFGDAFDIKGGATPSTKESSYWSNGKHLWATPKDMSGLLSNVLYRTERQLTAEGVQKISSKVLPVGTTLMSSRAPVGYLAIAKAPVAINQGFIAIPPTPGLPSSFILELLAYKMPEIKAHAGGSTFAEISKTQFRPIRWVRPDASVLSAYAYIAEPVYEAVFCNSLVIDALSKVRDELLPRLISGKLRIEEAEEAVAAIASGPAKKRLK